jgi:DNA-binding HxlR family transcriptional regulator
VAGYGQFCPVAKTAEVLCERWAPLIIRELLCGSRRFGEIQRGVPGISPGLLSKRLRQLQAAGVIDKRSDANQTTYVPTSAGWELYPIIEAMGVWGQRWARSIYNADELDPSLLMWDMRRMLQPCGLADSKTVVEFQFVDAAPGRSRYWLVVDENIDLCLVDPRLTVDLIVSCDVRVLTRIWMGDVTFRDMIREGELRVSGSRPLTRRFPEWLGRHPILGDIASADRSSDGTVT